MIYLSETVVNRTKGHRLGDVEPYESRFDDVGKLFRSLQREYGRCESRMYVDTSEGKAKPIGWVFVKRVPYDDSPETFLREVWVSLHEREPERSVEYFYHELD